MNTICNEKGYPLRILMVLNKRETKSTYIIALGKSKLERESIIL